MSGHRLPSISGSASVGEEKMSPHSSMFEVQPIMEVDEVADTQFDISFQKLLAIQFPPMNPVASVKNRLNTLEESAEKQHQFDKLTGQTFQNLSNNVTGLEDMMREIIRQSQSDMESKLATLKKEYDHRFELQANENKRLQSHITSLKADNTVVKKKLQGTIEKLRKLQHEFGDPDDVIDEESSILSHTGGMSTIRPHTIN